MTRRNSFDIMKLMAKKKMGRPKKKDPLTVPISFGSTGVLKAELEELAKTKGTTLSGLLRQVATDVVTEAIESGVLKPSKKRSPR